VQSGDDDRVWKQTARRSSVSMMISWRAPRGLPRGVRRPGRLSGPGGDSGGDPAAGGGACAIRARVSSSNPNLSSPSGQARG
ncbi:MAG: hypothetical protein ACK45V_13365, partial [Brevundimonas sp.]